MEEDGPNEDGIEDRADCLLEEVPWMMTGVSPSWPWVRLTVGAGGCEFDCTKEHAGKLAGMGWTNCRPDLLVVVDCREALPPASILPRSLLSLPMLGLPSALRFIWCTFLWRVESVQDPEVETRVEGAMWSDAVAEEEDEEGRGL